MSYSRSDQITPVVMRLKPDAVLPPEEEPSRDGLIDGLVQKLRTVFDGIPEISWPAPTEGAAQTEQEITDAARSHTFVIEAMEVNPCRQEVKDAVSSSVFETMKALLRLFGMVPKSIEVVEQ